MVYKKNIEPTPESDYFRKMNYFDVVSFRSGLNIDH